MRMNQIHSTMISVTGNCQVRGIVAVGDDLRLAPSARHLYRFAGHSKSPAKAPKFAGPKPTAAAWRLVPVGTTPTRTTASQLWRMSAGQQLGERRRDPRECS